ncbi:MAG: HD domain-containing protein [Planctomycetaceae bacterium]
MSHPYADIPEVSRAEHQSGVIRIPVEQDVPFTDRVRAIVDSREFQRLASVTQLALTSRVYPGATHTRFEHALGVYHNALQYLWQLGKDDRFADTVSTHDAEVLIAAALLHDVGHWPFCHPIEDMSLADMPPHEAFAVEFLGPHSELTAALRNHWHIEPDEILELLVPKSDTPSNRLRRSILSGPVDIDKMDYLNRDSQHCGVPYGRNFDRGRLIGSLVVNESGDGLAITSKGKTAAEMMVFARYVMFSEVYWHHTVRSATTMFARAFYESHRSVDLAKLFRMTEPELIRTLCRAAAGTDAATLIDGLFGSRRCLYKRLAEYSIYQQADLYRDLRRLPYSSLVKCSNRLVELLNNSASLNLRPLDVLIDAPPVHREVEFQVDVYFAAERIYRPLKDVSPIVDAMSRTQFDDCVKRVRVFASPAVMDSLRTASSLEQLVRAAVSDTMANSASG